MASGLLTFLGGGRSSLDLMQVAQELAVAMLPAVRSTVAAGSLPARRAEARGYVRAKCTPLVRQRVTAWLQLAGSVGEQLRASLEAEVAQRVLRLTLDELLRGRSRPIETRRQAA